MTRQAGAKSEISKSAAGSSGNGGPSDTAEAFHEVAPTTAGKRASRRQTKDVAPQEEDKKSLTLPNEQEALALVNRLPRADLEALLAECMTNGVLPLEKVRERLPEHHRSFTIKAIEIASKALRDESAGTLAVLPAEVQLIIFSMLPFYERLRACVFVCKAWRDLLGVETLWQYCDFRSEAKRFTPRSVCRLFGTTTPGDDWIPVRATISPTFVNKSSYKCDTRDAISAGELKKLFKVTKCIRDLELGGRSLTDVTVLEAVKHYSPNLVRIQLNEQAELEKFATVITILEKNPGMTSVAVRINRWPVVLADFEAIASAGALRRPGGLASRSPLTSLEFESRNLGPDLRSVMSNLGNWFPELEHLKIGYFDHIGIAQPPSMAPLPASGKLQRLKSLHLKFLLFAIPEVDGLKSQDESNQELSNVVTLIHGAYGSSLEHFGVFVSNGPGQPWPYLGGSMVSQTGGWPMLNTLQFANVRVGDGDLEELDAPLLQIIGVEYGNATTFKVGDLGKAIEVFGRRHGRVWAQCSDDILGDRLYLWGGDYDHRGAWKKVGRSEAMIQDE